ncbi:MAG: glycosyl hydrolase family 18 protein [Candidatus Zhuqueibacterota bacterium]
MKNDSRGQSFKRIAFWIALTVTSVAFSQTNELPGIHAIEHSYFKQQYARSESAPLYEKAIPLQERAFIPVREVFGYHPYWMNSAYPNYNYSVLSTIAYFGVDVSATGYIDDYHSWPVTGLINLAHSHGVKVVLVAINFDSGSLETLLSSSTNRTRLVRNLLTAVESANADGVNIDFEDFPSSQKSNLNLFMKALADTFHSHLPNSSVSIALPAVNWSNKFDYYSLATVCDALFIMGYNYYWDGSSNAGPVAPLSGWGTYNITWTVNDYLTRTQGQNEKIILGLPYYGIKWPTYTDARGSATLGYGSSVRYSTAESEAATRGKRWDAESQTPWYAYQSGSWYQAWYDDSLSLSKKYQLAIDHDLLGVGMWALGYDGSRQELWGALKDFFGGSTPPVAVEDFRAQNIGGGLIQVSASTAPDASEYRVYLSTDGVAFRLKSVATQPQVMLSGLSADSTYFFKMTAANAFGESPATEVLGAARAARLAGVLVVNGFDRLTVSGNTRDFVIEHGSAIKAAGHAFDSASNEAVQKGLVDLNDFQVVDWILGLESTDDKTFDALEQELVRVFMNQGGRLFVSGSEIGWHLDYYGTASDKEFYHTYLKASYVVDKVSDYSVAGTADGIFQGLDFSFDDGSHGIYRVGYPDGISAISGGEVCLIYNSSYNAGVQFSGTFGAQETKLVHFGFPFETIYPESARNDVMARVLTFLTSWTGAEFPNDPGKETLPSQPMLFENFPNPFNASTTFKFYLPEAGHVRLAVYNVRGELTAILLDEDGIDSGFHSLAWNGATQSADRAASGMYFVRLEVGRFSQTRRVVLLK